MPTREELERRFHQLMLDGYYETRDRSTAMGQPYRATRFLQMVRRRGGLGTARYYLNQRAPQPGFHRMINLGMPELAMEALVLQHPWRGLFTDPELGEARRRLEAELAHLRLKDQQRLADLLERELRELSDDT